MCTRDINHTASKSLATRACVQCFTPGQHVLLLQMWELWELLTRGLRNADPVPGPFDDLSLRVLLSDKPTCSSSRESLRSARSTRSIISNRCTSTFGAVYNKARQKRFVNSSGFVHIQCWSDLIIHAPCSSVWWNTVGSAPGEAKAKDRKPKIKQLRVACLPRLGTHRSWFTKQ